MFTAILAARQKKLREILNANATGCGKEKSHANEEDFLLNNMVAYGCSEVSDYVLCFASAVVFLEKFALFGVNTLNILNKVWSLLKSLHS